MGNVTNPEQWAAQERLRFIEKCAFWRGTVNRQDLQTVYGVSQAQSSADLQKYQELNPGGLVYSLNRKRYEGAPNLVCKLHEPVLEEAMGLFLGAGAVSGLTGRPPGAGRGETVARVELPLREAPASMQRAVFLAVLQRLRVQINYFSLTGNKMTWRWIAPHAFGHDGYRWHVRAWCEQRQDFRDFVISRIKAADWPTEVATPPVADEAWESWQQVVLTPNPKLTEAGQEAVKLDYGMRGGRLVLQVRKAMLEYVRRHLRLPGEKKDEEWLVETG